MKKILRAAAVVFLLFTLQSCKKEKSQWEKIQESNSGVITAKLNGKDWTSHIVNAYYDSEQRFGFGVDQYTGEIETETFGIGDIYLTKTINNIYNHTVLNGKKDSATAYFMLVDDDAVYCGYDVASDSLLNNMIFIDSYDDKTHMIAGRFELTMHLRVGHTAVRNWPDTLRFTEGKFHMTIKK